MKKNKKIIKQASYFFNNFFDCTFDFDLRSFLLFWSEAVKHYQLLMTYNVAPRYAH